MLAGTALAGASAAMAQAAPAASRSFSVPAGPASSSIPLFARQAGIQILMSEEAARGIRTREVIGAFDPKRGLDRLIGGTRLRIASWNGNVVTIVRQNVQARAEEAGDARNVGSEEIVVTGITSPFRSKSNATTIVETAVYDNVETPARDGSIAGILTTLPGISTVEDGEYPRYITIRGISPDLNRTTVDGLTLASVGENGSGTRQNNLQLMPSDLSSRVDVFKTFTAEQDGGAIGGAINIVTLSAFDARPRALVFDLYGLYRTRGGDGGSNKTGKRLTHQGLGAQGSYVTRFGANDEFGLVVSGRYARTPRDYSQNFGTTKRFFNTEGKSIARPDPALDWNGRALPGTFGYSEYIDVLDQYGGSAKLEYRSADHAFQASVMGYDYVWAQDQTANLDYIDESGTQVFDESPKGGRMLISGLTEQWRYDQYRRENRGVLGNASYDFGNSRLMWRTGMTQETYDNDEPYVSSVASPKNQYLTYKFVGDGTEFRLDQIEHPEILFDTPYKLNTQREIESHSRQRVFDTRLDLVHNVESGSRGLGYVVGGEYSHLTMYNNVTETDYTVSGNLDEWIYDPNHKPFNSPYSLAWFDYNKYKTERWDDFPINATASKNNSLKPTYRYQEDLKTAYASLHYSLPTTTIVAGLRYDDIDYLATTPIVSQANATGEFRRTRGGYENFLPSINILQRLGNTNLRASWSQTLGRPNPSSIASAETTSCSTNGEGDTACSVTRGNPDLKPRRSRNLDASIEHYYSGPNGMLELSYFRKDIKDDIFTLKHFEEIDGENYTINQPMNASDSWIQGLEFAWVHRGLPLDIANHKVDLSFNATRMWGHMQYVTDTGSRTIGRLVSQPDWIINGSATYRLPSIGGGVRLNAHYRSRFMTSIGANPWQDSSYDSLMSVNFAAWHNVTRNLVFKYEWNNIFDNQPKFRMGQDGEWWSKSNDYGSALFFHAIAKF